MKLERPKETPGVRKSSRLKFQTKHNYIPRMTASSYAVSVEQLKYHRALHPDAHMLFKKTQEEQTGTIKAIMTQISLKSGLK